MKNSKILIALLMFTFSLISCEPEELPIGSSQQSNPEFEKIGDSGEEGTPIDDKKEEE